MSPKSLCEWQLQSKLGKTSHELVTHTAAKSRPYGPGVPLALHN